VFAIVAWHLAVLLVRNPLDLWYRPIRDWAKEQPWWERHGNTFKRVDTVTWKYANFVGCEQGWCMFSPPMAERAPFLAVRIDFDDGSSELMCSDNEPEPTSFFRVGGWPLRKLEDRLGGNCPDEGAPAREWALHSAYVRAALRRWHQESPDDQRQPRRLVLLRRYIYFPRPGQPPHFDAPYERRLATFYPDGRPWR
jgi:hypothetical protein